MSEAIREGDIPGVQLRCRQSVPAPPTTVWRWLTEDALLARWLADEASVEVGPEGGIRLEGPDREAASAGGAAARLVEVASTLEWLPPGSVELPRGVAARWMVSFQRLEAGWRAPTRLTFELTALPDGGTELSVLQVGFQNQPLSAGLTIWERYRRRWRRALDRLAAAVAAEGDA